MGELRGLGVMGGLGGLLLAAAFAAGYVTGCARQGKAGGGDVDMIVTRETSVDTTEYAMPTARETVAMGTRRYVLPGSRRQGGVARRLDGPGKGGADATTVDSCVTGPEREPRCGGDSTVVELPTMQRHYADSTFEAWVSGPLDPRLDSLRVFSRTTTVTKWERSERKRWHIGVTAGYGYGEKGFQPSIGIGITYSLFSF